MPQQDLDAGLTKRVSAAKAMRGQAKYKHDYSSLKNFPKVATIKDGVSRAMGLLQGIALQVKGLESTPPALMGMATACVVFIIAGNGFNGLL